jgi:hypothetical protein
MYFRRSRIFAFFALLCLTWLGPSQAARAQAPAAPPAQPAPTYPAAQPAPAPPAQAYPPPQTYPQQSYPQQQAYPQQAYPQQAYPQQAYPQQAYPQQAYPQQAYPPRAYAPAPVPPPRKPRVKRGMLAAGISVLAASYGVSLITGAILVDAHCCEEVGAMLMVPLAGPFLAAEAAEDGRGMLVLLGAVQIVGTGLLIGGLVRYTTSKRAAEEQGYYSWQLRHERSLGIALSASPALAGSHLKLRF